MNMEKKWDQAAIQQRYIDDGEEESTILEYKAADALGKTPRKKKEIAKDVSAMANADGGIIIYGVKEYQEEEKKHLPEKMDPIDRTEFSKEWLEHVIAYNIRPRIDELTIHPVKLDTAPTDVIYVVEIPQSTTAHQVTANKDYRYYKRHNFESVPMEDYEIRDVMNRTTKPDAAVEFQLFRQLDENVRYYFYYLKVTIKNQGLQTINHFKLEFRFPYFSTIYTETELRHSAQRSNFRVLKIEDEHGAGPVHYLVVYRGEEVLFPEEEVLVGVEIGQLPFCLSYSVIYNHHGRWVKHVQESELSIIWTLYADDMTPKQDNKIPFSQLLDSSAQLP